MSFLLLASASSFAVILETDVAALDGRTCKAYLHFSESSASVPLILEQDGTGIYTTSRDEDLSNSLQYILSSKKAAILTIDKPGVLANPQLPQGFSVNDAIYNKHTQRDLIAGVSSAIEWAIG